MLSPTTRQVAHVLLTRSPLRIYRNKFSVRLACVKHAASVRPEPGSNSPKYFYFEEPLGSWKYWLCYFFNSLSSNSKLIDSVITTEVVWPAHSLHLIFSFQGSCCCLSDSFYILAQPKSFVNTFFKIFFTFFRARSFPSGESFIIIAYPASLCKYFFTFFILFFLS